MSGYEGNLERFTGFADLYDRYRFRPPATLAEMLCRFAGVERPALVADLGCGTGISTRLWEGRADRIVGIDPTAAMLGRARAATTAANVDYREGFGHETGLADDCADIVTCAQSFHWMDPATTLAEVGRILRPGGVFAAYNYGSLAPTGIVEVDLAAEAAMNRILELEVEHELKEDLRFFGKDEHPGRMTEAGVFAMVKQVFLGNVEMTSAERILKGLESMGATQTLRKMGISDEELGLTGLAAAAAGTIGDREVPAYVSYTVNIGVTPGRRAESPTEEA